VLARANRVVRGEDFRAVVRRGRRTATPLAVYYAVERQGDPARFGFIVSRAVGGSVQRNLLRRRLRAIGRELVDAGAGGADIVVRALPGSAERPWDELRSDARAAMTPRLTIGG
jgi:ribonuclease P protein component